MKRYKTLMDAIAYFLSRLIEIYVFIVIANVFLSWIVLASRNLTIHKIYTLTSQLVDPLLQPIRNIIRPITGNLGIDFSPMVLIFLLIILENLLIP
ncbi:YggT family protein [Candidatus Poribacteria bacterium]|nr:YggT family protein [Candidatus Poribacteria bacterium]MYB66403.1 YggT family protein [Candidatus Poribacteria bacterium]MYF55787.1 YggT family protein [Candidatus Poribacteria bacterium]